MNRAKPRAKAKKSPAQKSAGLPTPAQIEKNILEELDEYIEEEDFPKIKKTLAKLPHTKTVLRQLLSHMHSCSGDGEWETGDFNAAAFGLIWDHIHTETSEKDWFEILEGLDQYDYPQALPILQKYVSAFDLAQTLVKNSKHTARVEGGRLDIYGVIDMIDFLAPQLTKSERRFVLANLSLPKARKLEDLVALDEATHDALALKSPTFKRKI